ncbi:uncharacterized protein LOC132054168 [Lycium ferocissimum]|uniref:uncharacterized protein LOC132054168 n=1 Tax=Lycium ferocissimum TaxID=112874 RepID=UPI00281609A4|nr:uncharacterized protein LOC132054168 [Lycium ferocissimum]
MTPPMVEYPLDSFFSTSYNLELLGTGDLLPQVEWNTTKNRSKIKEVYLQLLDSLPKVEWRHIMSRNSARPKAIFHMWLQIHNRLLTVDRLLKWGMQVEPKCVFCKGVDETRDHIFFECHYAQQVWYKLMRWLKIQWPAHCSWGLQYLLILARTRGKSSQANVLKMVYSEFGFAIWNERNKRVFEDKEQNAESLAREIACICNVRTVVRSRAYLQSCIF